MGEMEEGYEATKATGPRSFLLDTPERGASMRGAILVVLFLLTSDVLGQNKPVVVQLSTGDFGTPLATSVGELVDRATIVVEGTVMSERPADLVADSVERPYTLTRTAFQLGSVEWIKSPPGPQPSGPVELVLPIGRRDRGEKIVEFVSEAFPTPKTGQRYLLFLRASGGYFELASHGSESAFLVEAGRVIPMGKSPLAGTLAGASRAIFVREIRVGIR